MNFDPAYPTMLEIGKPAVSIPCTTRKFKKHFMGDELEKDDIVIVPQLHQKRAQPEHVTLPRCTTTKKGSNAKPGKLYFFEGKDHIEAEDTFDDRQVAELSSEWKEQAPFETMVLSRRMRSENVLVDYRSKKV